MKELILMVSLVFMIISEAFAGGCDETSSKPIVKTGKYRFEESARNEDARKIPICRDFLTNLRALGNPVLVCDRKIHPKFKQFSWPKWKIIDSWKNRELIYQIFDHKYEQRKENFKNDPHRLEQLRLANEARKNSLKEDITLGQMRLAVSTIQIEGESTRVLRVEQTSAACDPTTYDLLSINNNGRELYLISNITYQIDFEATEKSALAGYDGRANFYNPDLFLYKGKPYVAYWRLSSDTIFSDETRSFTAKPTPRIEVFGDYENNCDIEYINNNEGINK